jgi:hypothetical protein
VFLSVGMMQFKAVEFWTLSKGEPLAQILHCLYIYPQSVNLSKKRNLFIRVELRKDDSDIRKPPLEALFPRDSDSSMQKYGHSQVDISTKNPHYHDEFKVRLPAVLTPSHHLLFTFFHVDLQMKLEAPKPVSIGTLSSILRMILCQSDSQAIGLPFAPFGCLAKDDPAVASESLSNFSFICLGDRW